MPFFDVKDPAGKVYPKVEAPTLQDAIAKMQREAAAGRIAPGEKIQPAEGLGVGESFMHGMGRPIAGAKQLGAHIAGSAQAPAIDKQIQESEAKFKQQGGSELAATVGSMVPMAPLGAAGPAGGVVGSAVGGAIAGLMSPIASKDDYWSRKVEDALLGGALGAGLGTAGAVMAPRLNADQAKLLGAGVKLTPGEINPGIGGITRRFEEAFKSWPVLGSFIRGAEARSRDSFNRAFLNQGLEFIGGGLPKGTPAGHAAIDAAYQQFNQKYDQVYNTIHNFAPDRDFLRDMARTRAYVDELGPAQAQAFDAVIRNRLSFLISGQPTMTAAGQPLPQNRGQLLRQADTALRNIEQNAMAREPEFAKRIGEVRAAVLDAVIRQNPGQTAQELSNLREGYALFARARAAAANRVKSDGVFTPGDLLAVIKRKDKSIDKARFAAGDALGQEFAEAAERVMGSKMPDSGTPERQRMMGTLDSLLTAGGAGAAAGAYATSHPDALKYMIATGALSAPYTRPGMAALNAMARNPVSRAVGQTVRGASAPAGIAGEGVLYGGPQQ